MTKKRGGQTKHWAERARVQAWYAAVKNSCAWSNYKLDYEFAWTDAALALRNTSERPRTFEGLAAAAREPQGKDARWRCMRELVDAVEQHPQFAGTKALYDAEIWMLLQEPLLTPEAVQARINRILKAYHLVRVPMDTALAGGRKLVDVYGLPSLYRRCLTVSFRRMDRYSCIALAWLLYVQNEPSHNHDLRAEVEMMLDTLLERFFANCLFKQHLDYYDDAIGALFRTRVDLSSRETSGYGFFETQGTWPVVPEDVVGKLTESDLIPELEMANLVASVDSR